MGGFYRTRRKFGNCWVEYRDLIDLMDCPSNIEIGLCWYQKGTNNNWSYDLTDRLMIDLEIMTTLGFMTYIVDEILVSYIHKMKSLQRLY